MLFCTFTAGHVEALKRISWMIKPPRRQGLAVILLIYLALATAYLVVVPPLEGFDAAAHMNAVNYWRQQRTPPKIDLATNQYSYELLTQPPLYYLLSALVTGWIPADNADSAVRASANRYFPGLSTRQSIDLPGIPQTVAWAMVLARLVSLLGGVLAVTATWLWIRVALPDQRGLPTAVAAVVAFNPLFLFIATSITNDAWTAAGTVTVIWLITAAAARHEEGWGPWFVIGLVAGVAALTKYSALLVAFPALVILLQYRLYRQPGYFLQVALLLFGGATLTAGLWYGRNLWLYGELIPLTAMNAIITSLQRPTLMPLAEMWELLPFIFYGYWGLFVAIFAPLRFFDVVRWAVLLAITALPIGLYWRRQWADTRPLWLALIWFVLTLVSMLNYMRLISYGEQARFLLPASPAIALLLVLGWQAWIPARLVPLVRIGVLLLMILLALWPLATLRAAYAKPSVAPADVLLRPVDAHFAGGLQLVGYALPTGAAFSPDGSLPLTLYFTADRPITDDYTLFVHLVDRTDRLLYQYDGVPFGGRHPTRQWQPGQVFADAYELALADPAPIGFVPTAQIATLIVGFYQYEAPTTRLTVTDHAGLPIGDRLVLGRIRLLDPQAEADMVAARPVAQWQAGIALLNAVVEEDGAGAFDIQLNWRTTTLLQRDYTMFLQFLDGAGTVVAQIDQEPQAGTAPTSTWLVDETIVDRYTLTPPATWQQLIVGIYESQSGQRLTLLTPTAEADFLTIERRLP